MQSKDILKRSPMLMAKDLYFLYNSEAEIVAKTGLSRSTIHKKAKKWQPIREATARALIADKLEHGAQGIASIIQVSIPLIQKSLQKRMEIADFEPLNIREMKDLSDIITNMDKILRLDAGRPTDIQTQTHLHAGTITLEELKQAIETDGFFGGIPLKEGVITDAEIIGGIEDDSSGSTREPDGAARAQLPDSDDPEGGIPRGTVGGQPDGRARNERGSEESPRGDSDDPFTSGPD